MELRDWLHKNRIYTSKFADMIGISRQYMMNIKNKKYSPSLELALNISHATNGEVSVDEIRFLKKVKFKKDPNALPQE